MSVFQKTGTANRLTFDELGSSSFKNKAGTVDPAPSDDTSGSNPASDAVYMREGRQVVSTRDGMTASITFLPGVDGSGNVETADANLIKVNDRWCDDPTDPTYDLICVSVKETPYGVTSTGKDRCLYTAEFSSQPLDPIELDFGGEFISIKKESGGFVWTDTGAAVNQTLHKITMSVKFKIVKRRSSLPYSTITARLGCVNSDEFVVPNSRGGDAFFVTGTDDGADPQNAFLLFEGAKAVETTDPKGQTMWKITYSFNAKYNIDSSGNVTGWNCIFRDSDASFQLTTPTLYRETDLSALIEDEPEV